MNPLVYSSKTTYDGAGNIALLLTVDAHKSDRT